VLTHGLVFGHGVNADANSIAWCLELRQRSHRCVKRHRAFENSVLLGNRDARHDRRARNKNYFAAAEDELIIGAATAAFERTAHAYTSQ
jgi:hypothetical protein